VSHAPIAAPAGGSAPRRVLEDESGRRLRCLRFVGRLVALLALVWLSLVALGGLGVGPAKHVPFGSALHIAAAPPPLRALPDPRPGSAADLVPAVPATALARAPARSTAPPAAASPPTVTKTQVDAHPGASMPKAEASRPATAKGRSASERPAAPASPGRSTAPHGRAATAQAKASPAAATHVAAARGQKARTATHVPAKPDKTSTATTTPTTTPATSRPGVRTAGTSTGKLGRKNP
jgi:hypothetical protein